MSIVNNPSPLDDIITPRLVLRLISPKAIECILGGNIPKAENLLHATIPAELLEHPSSLTWSQKRLDDDGSYFPWSARAIILKHSPQMVGIIRFHSSPGNAALDAYSTNAVELGYRIFSTYRNNRYATEAVGAIMSWAELHFNINRFVASVAPDNIPSNRLVSSFGFVKVGEVMDDVDGIEHVFLRVAGAG